MPSARNAFTAVLAAAALMVAAPAWAATTVTAQLWDMGGEKNMPTTLGHGMKGDMSKATMGIKLDKASVHAGRVNFNAINVSKDTIHELIVAPLKGKDQVLPYITDENRVNEDDGEHLGEISELDPGKSGTLGVDLKPGTYILYCNIPGHYLAGMWTLLTVTK